MQRLSRASVFETRAFDSLSRLGLQAANLSPCGRRNKASGFQPEPSDGLNARQGLESRILRTVLQNSSFQVQRLLKCGLELWL